MFKPDIKILIVDDMKTMRKVIMKSCTDIGFKNYREAEDGNEAWKVLNSEPIDLVISDWNMPNCTGIELLKKVRGDEKFKELPFMLLTAETEAAHVKDAIMAGVDNYVLKPFTTDNLKIKLQQVARKRGLEAA